jgi:hypothetical protein
MKSTLNPSPSQVRNNLKPEEFDLVILGGGTGSTIAAWTFAAEGKCVAVVERKYIGGSCPNIACLPSKNIIHSAKIASYFRRGEEFGITHNGFTIDMSGVRDRKRKMVSGLNDMYMENYRKTGAEFIFGTGKFIAPRTVEVTLTDGSTRQLRGTNVIVSTGTRAAIEEIPGLAEAQPLTHIEALELDQVPEHLLVIGGGYVGVEMSQALRLFGQWVLSHALVSNLSRFANDTEPVAQHAPLIFQESFLQRDLTPLDRFERTRQQCAVAHSDIGAPPQRWRHCVDRIADEGDIARRIEGTRNARIHLDQEERGGIASAHQRPATIRPAT